MKTAVVHQSSLGFATDLDTRLFVVADVMIFVDTSEVLVTLDVDAILVVFLNPVILDHSV